MSDRDPRHFATLGLGTDASPELIKRAYLALVKRWHPDRFANDPEQQKIAGEMMRTINVAYEALRGEAQVQVAFRHGSTAPEYDSADPAHDTARGAYAYRVRPSAFALWRGQMNWVSWCGSLALVIIAAASTWFAADTLAYHYGPPYTADFLRHEAKLQSVLARTRRAAEAGEVWAIVNMGWFHFNGRAVPVSKAEAAKWFALAGHAGDAGAQAQLGLMLAHGDGVPVNLAEAERWWELAAAQGHRDAARHRDEFRRRPNPLPDSLGQPPAPQGAPRP
ncbi:MAG: SEL1-like repeat protein [Verrucomicrobia bacterium]|nr:SEL1-like repeat protein [Verrucomicrobiota bacterium]